jgi:hypothetical protein
MLQRKRLAAGNGPSDTWSHLRAMAGLVQKGTGESFNMIQAPKKLQEIRHYSYHIMNIESCSWGT